MHDRLLLHTAAAGDEKQLALSFTRLGRASPHCLWHEGMFTSSTHTAAPANAAAGKWTRPEQVQELRPVYVLNSTRPGSDLLGSASAALSATAMAFRTTDIAYSLKAANHAVQLYK